MFCAPSYIRSKSGPPQPLLHNIIESFTVCQIRKSQVGNLMDYRLLQYLHIGKFSYIEKHHVILHVCNAIVLVGSSPSTSSHMFWHVQDLPGTK